MPATYVQDRTNAHLISGDADLLLRLRIALSIKRRAGWHLVSIAVRDGAVTLAGVVPSFYDRQLIASLVRHVAGVHRIDDKLAVGDPSLRQQVANAEMTQSKSESTSNSPTRNQFSHLPVLSQSLDDIAPIGNGIALPAV